MKKTIINYSVIVLILVVVIGAFYLYNKDAQTVEVIGNSQITVPPDEVSVYLSIETSGKTAEEAKNKNSEITNNVISSLKQLGIESIETENFNIYQDYDYQSGKTKGYKASNYIKVKTNNFDLIGKVIDSSVDKGALISSINFELSSEKSNEVKADALAKASQDAKMKAGAIAQGLDKKLGSLVSVSTSDYNYIPYPLFREGSAEDAKAATINIQPKNLDIQASVKAIYKIR